jgi:hypothetical protein
MAVFGIETELRLSQVAAPHIQADSSAAERKVTRHTDVTRLIPPYSV